MSKTIKKLLEWVKTGLEGNRPLETSFFFLSISLLGFSHLSSATTEKLDFRPNDILEIPEIDKHFSDYEKYICKKPGKIVFHWYEQNTCNENKILKSINAHERS